MILPPAPCAIICRAASCMPIITPSPLTPMMKFQLSSVTSRKFIGLLTPALLNLTSSFPNRATVAPIMSRTDARSRTSTAADITFPPPADARASLRAAASAALPPFRSAKQTSAPSSSNASPMARPMP